MNDANTRFDRPGLSRLSLPAPAVTLPVLAPSLGLARSRNGSPETGRDRRGEKQ